MHQGHASTTAAPQTQDGVMLVCTPNARWGSADLQLPLEVEVVGQECSPHEDGLVVWAGTRGKCHKEVISTRAQRPAKNKGNPLHKCVHCSVGM